MRQRRVRVIATCVAAIATGLGVSAPAAGAGSPHDLSYVQLGDSYSSGNGAGTYDEQTCWRSPDNYGARVAEQMGATYDNVACSGGKITDILNPRELGTPHLRTATYSIPATASDARQYWLSQAKQRDLCGVPAQGDWYYDYSITSSVAVGLGTHRSMTATVECQLTAAPQIEAVTPDTDAVFVTIGGNDIGFTNIVVQCMVLRSPLSCEPALDEAMALVPTMKQDTIEALTAVHERSKGRADIYLLGYPHLLNADSYGIPELTPTYDAGAALADLQLLGDRVQREGAAELDAALGGRGDVTFVDVKPAWEGYAHGLDPHTVADNRQAWLVPVLAPGRQLAEWVHPTADGYAATAGALLAAMD